MSRTVWGYLTLWLQGKHFRHLCCGWQVWNQRSSHYASQGPISKELGIQTDTHPPLGATWEDPDDIPERWIPSTSSLRSSPAAFPEGKNRGIPNSFVHKAPLTFHKANANKPCKNTYRVIENSFNNGTGKSPHGSTLLSRSGRRSAALGSASCTQGTPAAAPLPQPEAAGRAGAATEVR